MASASENYLKTKKQIGYVLLNEATDETYVASRVPSTTFPSGVTALYRKKAISLQLLRYSENL